MGLPWGRPIGHSRGIMANFTQMLLDLREEREQLEHVIHVIERLALGGKKRRGRPPAWLKASQTAPARKRKPFSAATRRKMSAAQTKRWAARKVA